MTSESYSIVVPTISSGGSASMESGSYRMMDIKGQAVIGSGTSPAYSAELGGVYAEAGAFAAEEGVPEGTVRLYIARQGSDVKIYWTAPFAPEIYALAAVGDPLSGGNYKDGATYYKQVYPTTHADFSGQFDLSHVSEKYILHRAEAGSSFRYREVYYKGVVPGRSDRIGAAWAAGKYTYTLSPGFNLISYPFIAETPNTLDSLFGSQLNTGTKLTADRIMQKKGATTFSYNWAYLFTDNQWHDGDTGSISTIEAKNIDGYFVWVKGTEKPVTLVGRVTSEAAYYIETGWDLIGVGFPASAGVETLGLQSAGAFAGSKLTADRIMRKKSADLFSYYWAFLRSSDNRWIDGDTGSAFTYPFQPPHGYFYWRKGSTPFPWSRSYSD
jgi:hypothetical protein